MSKAVDPLKCNIDLFETFQLLGLIRPALPSTCPSLEQNLNEGTEINLASHSYIQLAAKKITDEKILQPLWEALKLNTTITRLFLYDLRWKKEIWIDICSMLLVNKSILSIRYEGNSLCAEGAAALSKVLRQNSTLTRLDVGDTKIPESGLKKIFAALENNKSLNALSFYENRISETGAQAIGRSLKTNKGLTKLDLSATNLSTESIKKMLPGLLANTTLTTIYFSFLSGTIDTGFAPLMAEIIAKTKIQRIGFAMAEKDFWKCEKLTGFEIVGPPQAKLLANSLRLSQTIKTLNLRSAALFPSGAKEIIDALKTNKSLTFLGLSFCHIGSKSAPVIDLLCQNLLNHPLKALFLDGNDLTEKDASSISRMLTLNTALETLSLNSNRTMGASGANAVVKSLAKNKGLTNLQLQSMALPDVTLQLAAASLLQNTTLKTLDLSANYADANSWKDEGFQAMAEALKKNTTLTQLDLSSTNEGPITVTIESTTIFGEMLSLNSTLTVLSLDNNNFDASLIEPIASGLARNKGLTALSLTDHKMQQSELTIIAEALRTNLTLKRLDLGIVQLPFMRHVALCSNSLTYVGWTLKRLMPLEEKQNILLAELALQKNGKLRYNCWKVFSFLWLAMHDENSVLFGYTDDIVLYLASCLPYSLINAKNDFIRALTLLPKEEEVDSDS